KGAVPHRVSQAGPRIRPIYSSIFQESDEIPLGPLGRGHYRADPADQERVVVLLISPAPVTVVAVLYADTVLKAAGVDRIQAPSLTATIGEKSVRPPSCEDDETRVRRHEIP